MWILVAKQLFVMMMIVLLGFVFAKATKVTDGEQKFLSRLLLYFINPCLIINSFNLAFDAEKLKALALTVLLALLVHAVMILVSLVFTSSQKQRRRGLHSLERVGLVFTNCGFMGIPLIRGVFGEEGVFFLMGYLVIFNIMLWTYGYYQLCGSISLRKIITNPNILAVVAGVILFCLPVTIPELIIRPLSMIAELNTAVSMLLIGVLFAGFKRPQDGSFVPAVIRFSVIRLVLCAAVNLAVLFLLYSFFSGLPSARMLVFVVFICSMCPAATSVPSLACLFNKDTSYASLIVSVTSLLCVITIPLFVALGERLLV